jgi:hypothetical protein
MAASLDARFASAYRRPRKQQPDCSSAVSCKDWKPCSSLEATMENGQTQLPQMKTMKSVISVLTLACSLLLVSCTSTTPSSHGAKASALYLCPCSADCSCATVAVKPGKCGCGKELVAVHPLKVEAGSVLACPCGPRCGCTLDAKDPTKCGCGKAVRKVTLKGSGLYYCACEGGCCVVISDKPGKCGCGKDLKQAD